MDETDLAKLEQKLDRVLTHYRRHIITVDELAVKTQEVLLAHCRHGVLGSEPEQVDDAAGWELARRWVCRSGAPFDVVERVLDGFPMQQESVIRFHEGALMLEALWEELDRHPDDPTVRASAEDQMLTWLADGLRGDILGRLLERMSRVALHFQLDRVFTEGWEIIQERPSPMGRFQGIWARESERIRSAASGPDEAV